MRDYNLPFRSYEGDEPYVFVSYSHKDSPVVFEIIGELHERGFRIWYDEGIDPGTEWPEEIAGHLNACTTFLLFMSPNASGSHNVRREINFAIDNKKHLICVYLSPTELSLGMQLQLSLIQSVHYTYPDTEDFYHRVEKALSQAGNIVASSEKPEPTHIATPEPTAPVRKNPAIAIVLSIAALAAVLLLWSPWNSGRTGTDSPSRGEPTPTAAASPGTVPPTGNAGNGVFQVVETVLDSSLAMPEVSLGEFGNLGGNINSNMPQGFAVQRDNSIFLVHNNTLYSMEADGDNVFKMGSAHDLMPSLNVMGDWVYYTNLGLYRIKTDGSAHEALPLSAGYKFIGVGEWLYFLGVSPNGIWRIRLDGKILQQLSDVNAVNLYVDENWIYYDDFDNPGYIYRISTDGSLPETVADDSIFTFHMEAGWLYYESNRYGTCRVNLDTEEVQQIDIMPSAFYSVIVKGDDIFYLNDRVLWKCTADGLPQSLCVFSRDVSSFNVVDEWVFVSVGDKLYRCSHDGGEPEDITELLEQAPWG